MSKLMNTVRQSWLKESKMDTLIVPPSLEILKSSSKKVMPKHIREWLMSSPQAFPVKSSQPLAKEREEKQTLMKSKPTQETSGPPLGMSLAWFCHDTSCLRMSQGCLLPSISGESYPRLPDAGIFLDGKLYPQPRWVPHINDYDGGLSESWPTPRGQDSYERRNMKTMERIYDEGGDLTLTTKIKVENKRKGGLWPTPRKFDGTHNWQKASKDRHRTSPTHETLGAAVKMWPTPSEHGMTEGKDNERQGNFLTSSLVHAVKRGELRKWPTPREQDHKHGAATEWELNTDHAGTKDSLRVHVAEDGVQGQLNPDWVEWLMFWPIGWSSLQPLKELIWLDWSVDPADGKEPEMHCTPTCDDASGSVTNAKDNQIPMLRRSANKLYRSGNIGPIPRIATNIKDRVSRLKAIGNVQVPICAAKAFKVLT